MKIYDKSRFDVLPGAILFDTDNTLYSYEPAHRAALNAVRRKVVSRFGVSATDFDRVFSEARTQVKRCLGNTAASHNRLIYMQRTLELFGLGSQVLVALDLEQTYWREFLTEADLFDGVIELLDDLRLLGIPLAIVTDLTAQIQFRKIVYFGLENYFDFVVTSEEAGEDKPGSAPFRLAVDKIGKGNEPVWMIGDNPVADILGGKMHINAVVIQKLHAGVSEGVAESKPDAIFKEFDEIRALVARLSQLD